MSGPDFGTSEVLGQALWLAGGLYRGGKCECGEKKGSAAWIYRTTRYGQKSYAHCLKCGASWRSMITSPALEYVAFYDRLIRNALGKGWCSEAEARGALDKVCGHDLQGKLTRWRKSDTGYELDLGEVHLHLTPPDWSTTERTFHLELSGAQSEQHSFTAFNMKLGQQQAEKIVRARTENPSEHTRVIRAVRSGGR